MIVPGSQKYKELMKKYESITNQLVKKALETIPAEDLETITGSSNDVDFVDNQSVGLSMTSSTSTPFSGHIQHSIDDEVDTIVTYDDEIYTEEVVITPVVTGSSKEKVSASSIARYNKKRSAQSSHSENY
jgi:outer membrane translocation and assembly module TamA